MVTVSFFECVGPAASKTVLMIAIIFARPSDDLETFCRSRDIGVGGGVKHAAYTSVVGAAFTPMPTTPLLCLVQRRRVGLGSARCLRPR